MLIRKEALF